MPLPIPRLDDRKFQDIVDELKSLIPHYSLEWTDHNVSDPGVTLIELFAHVAEIILFRLNRLPEVFQLVLLNLLGEMPKPPQSAETRVAFWLVQPRKAGEEPNVANGASGIEVSTVQTETEPPIIFTTLEPIRVHAAKHILTYRRRAGQVELIDGVDNIQATGSATQTDANVEDGKRFIFSRPPKKGDAMYFGFEVLESADKLTTDLSHHILRFSFKLHTGQVGFDKDSPPYHWSAYVGGTVGWAPCVRIEGSDTTDAFYKDGSMEICLPAAMQPATAKGVVKTEDSSAKHCLWVKIEMTEDRGVEVSVRDLRVASVGLNVLARHERILNRRVRSNASSSANQRETEIEIHGISNGLWGQRFRLPVAPILQPPVLPAMPTSGSYPEFLEVIGDDAPWSEVRDLAKSEPTDRHYMVDRHNGEIVFPPALRLPTGEIRYYGKAPARNRQITLRNYRIGGGIKGNVREGKINTLRSSNPEIARVQNLADVENGRDAETIDIALLRVASLLHNGGLPISVEDIRLHTWRILTENKISNATVMDVLCNEDADSKQQVNVVLFFSPSSSGSPDDVKKLGESVRCNLQQRCLLGTVINVQTIILKQEEIL